LVIGILIVFVEYKAVDFATVFVTTPIFSSKIYNFLSFDFDLILIICYFLFIGAVGKLAQLGLHTWLPTITFQYNSMSPLADWCFAGAATTLDWQSIRSGAATTLDWPLIRYLLTTEPNNLRLQSK
jgi:hypothetical protein